MTGAQQDIDVRPVEIVTQDGRTLRGDHILPTHRPPHAAVLCCASTATPRYIYKKFATHLARQGFASILFDYQGISESRTLPLRQDPATKRSWASLDMPAALDRLEEEHPALPLFLLGHSVGGQLMGLMPNRHKLCAVASFAATYGYWGYMPSPTRYGVFALWHGVMPVALRLLGYTPARLFGFGEDMPAGVGADWARWGRRPDYFEPELSQEPGFVDLTIPWLNVLASDDAVASPQSAEALMRAYPNMERELIVLRPEEYGLKAIGHMGFFKESHAALWPIISGWLLEQSERISRVKREERSP